MQIGEPAKDVSRYYPPQYYSFRHESGARGGIRNWLAGRRDRFSATGAGSLGLWLLKHAARPRAELASMGRIPARRDMRILDVGCGQGQLLTLLHRAGFFQLVGIDPLLPCDVEARPGLWVRRSKLEEVEGQFDLIMLHHVFEHMEHPQEMLSACRDHLVPGGSILLRIPTVACAAWERYRTNWVQLDAPRHLFLHTRISLNLLAEKSGLSVRDCWCDSSAFQFWGSELYQRGVPLFDAEGRMAEPRNYFTSKELSQFERDAAAVNAASRGDQIALILR